MTKEQAIKFANCLKNNYTIDFNDMADFCDTVIKALEQLTSDDCVSIVELEKWLDLNFSFGGACKKLELFERLEKELPRVTPTRKVGKWESDGHGHIYCTACNEVNVSLWKSKYCPCCSAEMVGAENE